MDILDILYPDIHRLEDITGYWTLLLLVQCDIFDRTDIDKVYSLGNHYGCLWDDLVFRFVIK